MCVPLAGIVAVILGVLGLRNAGQRGGTGQALSIVGMVLGALATVLLIPAGLFTASIAIPAFARAHEIANRVKCAANLRTIGVALNQYSAANAGQMPPTLPLLIQAHLLTQQDLICPDDSATSTTQPASSYAFVNPQATMNGSARSAVVSEPPTLHKGDGANVLFGDGHVEWLNAAALSQIARQTPPPASGNAIAQRLTSPPPSTPTVRPQPARCRLNPAD